MKTNSKKALKITLWCVLGAILLFVLIVLGSLLVEKFVKKSRVPMFAGYGSMVVLTGSMRSTINAGDLVIIKRVDEYKLNDIVTFYDETERALVTHRLIRFGPEEGTFVTKGDGNDTEDIELRTVDEFYGKIVLTIPKLGLFFEWFTQEGGLIYAVALIAIVIAGVYLWKLFKPEPEAEAAESEASASENALPAESGESRDSLQTKEEKSQEDFKE